MVGGGGGVRACVRACVNFNETKMFKKTNISTHRVKTNPTPWEQNISGNADHSS